MAATALRLNALARIATRVHAPGLTPAELEILADELPWLVDECQRLHAERDALRLHLAWLRRVMAGGPR